MKRNVLIILICLSLIILIKYYISSYNISYKIDDYSITEAFNNNKTKIEITGNKTFIIEIYKKRSYYKKLIEKIEKIEKNNYECYNISVKKEQNRLVCFKDNESIAYYLIEDEEIKKYISALGLNIFHETDESENFKFYNNIDKNVYIALWNYNGFYLMNNEEISEIKVFNNSRYDNSLCYLFNEYLLLPNYDQIHEFDKLKIFNIKTGELREIVNKNMIDYDSYISGKHKNNIYMFDNKYLKLYEISIKKNRIEEIGNENKGYIKIENNKKKNALKTEYKNRITYFNLEKSKYQITDALYRVYNNEYKVKIFNSNEIQIIKEYKNELYFIYKDNLYMYNDVEGVKKVFHHFELNFNFKNMVYIYIK